MLGSGFMKRIKYRANKNTLKKYEVTYATLTYHSLYVSKMF